MRLPSAFLSLIIGLSAAHAQERPDPRLPQPLPLEERSRVQDAWLRQRLDELVPTIMRREGVDMWILVAGEYNEDPVVETMLPSTWLSARRTTILVFHDRGEEEGVERFAVARYPVADLFPTAWEQERDGGQWERLAELVREKDPETIAVNMSAEFPLADGLSASMRDKLTEALGPLESRLVSRPELALSWLGQRIEPEIAAYPTIVQMAHAIIDEAFSEEVITPGVTTSDEVRWFLRQRVSDLGLDAWFHPSVNIQRQDQEAFGIASMGLANETVIMPGDFIHVDFGIVYLGLATDTQHHAYILRPGETEAPAGLRRGLRDANRVQDALLQEFEAGRIGNDVLAAAYERTKRAGLDANIYSHPIGYHGHGAGPWIGAWERPDAVPGRGEALVHPYTAWSIELSASREVPEWGGQEVRFMTEEDAYFDGEQVRFLDGRQTEITLIPRQN